MDVKDKIVNLNVLKTVVDSIKNETSQWDDITSTITWSGTTTHPTGSYSDGTIGTMETMSSNYDAKLTTLSVVAGDEFIIIGTKDNLYSYIALFTATSPSGFGQVYKYFDIQSSPKKYMMKIVIPFDGTLKIYDYILSGGSTTFNKIEKRRR